MMKMNRGPIWTRVFYPALMVFVVISVTRYPALAAAQPEQDDRAVAATGVEFQPRLGEYHYEVTWGRTRVATATVIIERDGDHYRLQADQKTTDFIDRIYRVRYRGETHIKVEDLLPVDSVIEEEVKKRQKRQEARYNSETGSVAVVETRSMKNQSTVEKNEYELQSDTGIVDIFSAIFLARSFDWQIGERHEFQVFIGTKQYQVTMDCIGVSTFVLDDDTIPVWVIRPDVRKKTEDRKSSVHHETRIYISADESKDIVKIKSKPGIGTVKLRLVKYKVN